MSYQSELYNASINTILRIESAVDGERNSAHVELVGETMFVCTVDNANRKVASALGYYAAQEYARKVADAFAHMRPPVDIEKAPTTVRGSELLSQDEIKTLPFTHKPGWEKED